MGNDGLVIALEPHPVNYKLLCMNVRLNRLRNVHALNLAAYSQNCELPLFIGITSEYHTVIKNISSAISSNFIKVQAKTLDDILNDFKNLSKVEYIKIDVKGAEYQVLKGAIKSIKKFKPKLIIEIWNPGKVLPFMTKLGYCYERIGNTNNYFFYFPKDVERM